MPSTLSNWRRYCEVPVFVPCEVLIANILAGGGVIGRAVPAMEPVRMVVRIAFDPVWPGRGDHKNHHLGPRRGRAFGNEIKPVDAVGIEQQQRIHPVFRPLGQLLIGHRRDHHMATTIPAVGWHAQSNHQCQRTRDPVWSKNSCDPMVRVAQKPIGPYSTWIAWSQHGSRDKETSRPTKVVKIHEVFQHLDCHTFGIGRAR